MFKLSSLTFLFVALCASAHPLDARLAAVKDYAYLLQIGDTSMASLAATDYDLLVIDYSRDGSAATELTPQDIATLKASGKVVLAYLSIGEAEDYRYYWQPAWGQNPPAWLGPTNPDWAGNYKVRYWHPGWQSIMYGTAAGSTKAYLDRIIDQGFDGIYMDIVDAFYYWSTNAGGKERTRQQARQDMVTFVANLRNYARVTRGRPDFLVFPQNAQSIIYNDDETAVDAVGQQFLSVIDGIGNEDVWYDELNAQANNEREYILTLLEIYRTAPPGRLVLDVDYVWNPANPNANSNKNRYNDFKQRALAAGIVSYAAPRNRELDVILDVPATNGFLYPQPIAPTSAVADWQLFTE